MSSAQGRNELQGPRPTPLKICRESHKVRKPPLPLQAAPIQHKPPLIIYTYSPKIIHTDAGEFMTLVQRLTGRAPAPATATATAPAPVSSRLRFQPEISFENPNNCMEVSKEESAEFGGNTPLAMASPNIQSGLFSPLSPSIFLPPSPLFTPQSQSDYFFSPRHIFYRQSEAIFTPPAHLRPYLNMNAFSSPSPTGYDLFNNHPDF